MNELNIFEIAYRWYEGEHEETLLGKNVSEEEFEKDLTEAKNFAEGLIGIEIEEGSYLGKGYKVDCLPEYYEQILWFLTEKKGYVSCNRDENVTYFVDDGVARKIALRKQIQKVEWQELAEEDKNGSKL
jgi:hypothetical protein